MEDEPLWKRDDLVARLRMEASINQGNAKLCGDAADEIERLRLTDAERKVLEWATLSLQQLRKLLERCDLGSE